MSGRRRLFDDPMCGYNVRLTAAHARKARKLGDGNMGEGIRLAIEAAKLPDHVLGFVPIKKVERH